MAWLEWFSCTFLSRNLSAQWKTVSGALWKTCSKMCRMECSCSVCVCECTLLNAPTIADKWSVLMSHCVRERYTHLFEGLVLVILIKASNARNWLRAHECSTKIKTNVFITEIFKCETWSDWGFLLGILFMSSTANC